MEKKKYLEDGFSYFIIILKKNIKKKGNKSKYKILDRNIEILLEKYCDNNSLRKIAKIHHLSAERVGQIIKTMSRRIQWFFIKNKELNIILRDFLTEKELYNAKSF